MCGAYALAGIQKVLPAVFVWSLPGKSGLICSLSTWQTWRPGWLCAMWVKFANNPLGKSVGDCSVRAISAALSIDWYEAYDLLCAEGRVRADMPDADATIGALLRAEGFSRHAIPNHYHTHYTAADFVYDHEKGIYVLAFGGHVATARDGTILDSWDSENEVPIYYYSRR